MVSRLKKKTSSVRQKIEIKRITGEEARQVCFSKRHAGLFKKAHELSILCGVKICLVVFSLAGKPYSYGHPSVDSIIDRYLIGDGNDALSNVLRDSKKGAVVRELNRKHEEGMEKLQIERRKRAELGKVLERGEKWNGNMEDMSLDQLECIEKQLESLKREMEEVMMSRRSLELCMHESFGGLASVGNNEGALFSPPCISTSYQDWFFETM